MKAMIEMKDTPSGENGVRLMYICSACDEVHIWVIEMVKNVFEKRAYDWDENVRSGIIVPLFKKGDVKCLINSHRVCLLSMCSCSLAGIISKIIA